MRVDTISHGHVSSVEVRGHSLPQARTAALGRALQQREGVIVSVHAGRGVWASFQRMAGGRLCYAGSDLPYNTTAVWDAERADWVRGGDGAALLNRGWGLGVPSPVRRITRAELSELS